MKAYTVEPRCNGQGLGTEGSGWMEILSAGTKKKNGCCKDVAEVRLYIR